MFIYHIKNFITLDECAVLNHWVEKTMYNPNTKHLFKGNTDSTDSGSTVKQTWSYDKRLTTRNIWRNSTNQPWEYPELAYNIFGRIKEHLDFSSQPVISGHGKNGIVVTSILDGGNVFKHTDPGDPLGRTNYEALRCNILTSKPDTGGTLHIGDNVFELEEGDLICYLVSKYPHSVDVCKGDKKRNLWMFGLLVDYVVWETVKKDQLLNRPHMDFSVKAIENQ